MIKQNMVSSLMLILLALTTLTSSSYDKYCSQKVNGATPSSVSGTTYIQDVDDYIHLSNTQILLDMRSQIESIGAVAYTYYLQAGETYFNLRLIKVGTDGQPLISLTAITDILITAATADVVASFKGGESGVVALQQVQGVLKFYQLSSTPTFSSEGSLSSSTQTLVKIITGGGQTASPAYYYLTKDTDSSQAHFYDKSTSFSTPSASITLSNSQNFIFACPSGFLEIDSTPANTGCKAYKTTDGTLVSISGTVPNFATDLGINRNFDVIVMDFSDSFFVAMYDEQYSTSVMFQISNVLASPSYLGAYETVVIAGRTLSYHTDYTTNFLQLATDSTKIVKSITLYFVDNYDSANQHPYGYRSPGSPTGDDQTILDDLTLSTASNLKVSFSLVSDGSGGFQYNIFILRLDSTTKIIRYRYSAAGISSSFNSISAGNIARDYEMALSVETQTLFQSSNGEVQVTTFEISCICTVTTISEFICFGASLECTIAIQNLDVECAIENAGSFNILVGDSSILAV